MEVVVLRDLDARHVTRKETGGPEHLAERLGSGLAHLIPLILQRLDEHGDGLHRIRPDLSQRLGGDLAHSVVLISQGLDKRGDGLRPDPPQRPDDSISPWSDGASSKATRLVSGSGPKPNRWRNIRVAVVAPQP